MGRMRSTAGATGIAPGSPFVLGAMLIVSSVNPAIASTGRLRQVPGDPVQSIVAPGVTVALRTFMLGAGVGEGTGNLRSIFVGDNIVGVPGAVVGAASDQLLYGADIVQLVAYTNVDHTILIGNGPTFSAATGQFGNSIYIGSQLFLTPTGYADTFGTVLIGNGGRIRGTNSIGIGAQVDAAGDSTMVGKSGLSAIQGTGVGQVVNVGLRGAALGHRARTGDDGISIGFFADSLGQTNCIMIGRDTAPGGAFNSVVCIGRGTVAFENNCFALGGDQVNGTEMRVLRLGPNTLAGYPGLAVFLPSAAAGNNVAAPTTTIRGGISTGNTAAGGKLAFQTSLIGAGGGAYQALIEVLRFQSGGTVGNPTVVLSNQISTVGAQTVTWLNAPGAAGPKNPAGYLEVIVNGVLSYIPFIQ
jgi:hypothetical protein